MRIPYTRTFLGTAGSADGFLARFDSGGSREWTRLFGSATKDVVAGVAVDQHGNVYTSGSFGNSNTTSVFVADSLVSAESAGGMDGFLIKHSASGDVLWLRTLGTSSDDSAQDVTTDEMGNIYVAGPRLFSFPLLAYSLSTGPSLFSFPRS